MIYLLKLLIPCLLLAVLLHFSTLLDKVVAYIEPKVVNIYNFLVVSVALKMMDYTT